MGAIPTHPVGEGMEATWDELPLQIVVTELLQDAQASAGIPLGQVGGEVGLVVSTHNSTGPPNQGSELT